MIERSRDLIEDEGIRVIYVLFGLMGGKGK